MIKSHLLYQLSYAPDLQTLKSPSEFPEGWLQGPEDISFNRLDRAHLSLCPPFFSYVGRGFACGFRLVCCVPVITSFKTLSVPVKTTQTSLGQQPKHLLLCGACRQLEKIGNMPKQTKAERHPIDEKGVR